MSLNKIKLFILSSPRIYNLIQNSRTRLRLVRIMWGEMFHLFRYSGSMNELTSLSSLETQILLRTHGVEKGLSLRAPRKGFGQKNILELIRYLDNYRKRGGNDEFIRIQCGILDAYIQYHQDSPESIEKISSAYQAFRRDLDDAIPSRPGGIIAFSKEENLSARKGDFAEFARSRHSMRYFDNAGIDMEGAIKKALDLAQCSPSACNRQPQRVYLFRGSAKDEMLAFQQGSNAFASEIDSLLLVTANQSRYCLDIHQPYVDGGLYAMNLLYSLHYYGLGTIPLSAGMITAAQRKKMCRKWNIPMNEDLILLIAVGGMPQDCRSNLSRRNPSAGIFRVIQ
ncbi:MAG: nitroreductase family protein [Lentisphaeria bacterium]|nr:nitroreductase family protein [Lentisphaeria bacterium]